MTIRAAMMLTALLLMNKVAGAAPQLCAEVNPIAFEAGKSKAAIHGAVARGELQCFSLSARAGQKARLSITSVEGNAVFQFYRPGWKLNRKDGDLMVEGAAYPHAGEGDDTRRWSGRLAGTGDQLVVVGSARGGADWRLEVLVTR